MGLSFFEVMRGELTDRWGRQHAADFSIKAEATHLAAFMRTGKARITGIVRALPWAEDAALEGEVRISLFRRREIAYRFRFKGDDQRVFELAGKKTIRWTRPTHSLTHMSASLTDDRGTELATGQLVFDTHDLPEFLRSWFPSTSIQSLPLKTPDETFTPDGVLSEGGNAQLRALIEAVIAPGEHVPAADEETVSRSLEFMGQAGQMLPAFEAALRTLDAISLAKKRATFASLGVEERRDLLMALSDDTESILHRAIPPRLLVQMLTIPIKSGHFSRADYHAAIGYPQTRQIAAERRPRWYANVFEAEALERETELECDVVVVGTGAGGAAVAAELAKRGLAVAIVEEGRFRHREDFGDTHDKRVRDLWRYRATNISLGTPVSLPLGRAVGGTTIINSGTCFSTPASVLNEWRGELGFPDDFDPDVYGQWSERVERMLQVQPGDLEACGKIAQVIARGADALGYAHGPLPRNAPGCPGAGECIFGCPEGAKQSTDQTYVPAALKSGASLFVGLPVTRLLMRGREVVAVEARGSDLNGRSKTLRIRARRVVLSCGSLITPVLLQENGIDLPWLGKNLSVHPALGLVARCAEDLEPWNAIPQGYTVEALEEDGIRFEGYWLPPTYVGPVVPWVGDELARWMDDFRRLGQFGFMVRDRGRGRVRRGPDGRPIVTYTLDRESMRRLKKGAALCAEIFLEGGASEVYAPIAGAPIVRSRAEARDLAHLPTRATDFAVLGAHPLGTVRMGASPEVACVDFDHRVYGTDNLHVVDGGSVPTSLGVNPQMTIMAMALRAGERIADLLG